MAAILNKYVKILLVFIVFPSLSCADQIHAPQEQLNSYQISLKRFEKHKLALENAITMCGKNRQVIDRSLLEPLGLDLSELKIALFVLNQRAEALCENDLREKFFYTAAIHRQVAHSYGVKAEDAENYREELLLVSARKKMDYEADYLSIDKKSRLKLESISELKSPFLILETIQQFE